MPLFDQTASDTPPSIDEFEISLFGRGVGECLVLHLGNGRWMIVDSHLHPETREPISLEYLSSIGVSYERVEHVVITHWDKDHIAGVTKVIQQCQNARVYFPSAFKESDFTAFLGGYYDATRSSNENNDFSTNDIHDAFSLALQGNRENYLTIDRLLLSNASPIKMKVYSLSPIDQEITEFLAFIASKIPQENHKPLRVVDRKRNFLSSALWIEVADTTVLLGADMMSSENRKKGWAAIIDRSNVLKDMCKAGVYKVAHHGAESGDHEEVWKKLLMQNPIAILAPFTAQREPIPTRKDVMRLERTTDNAFLTSSTYDKIKIEGRHPSANRVAKQRSVPIRCLERGLGQIRLKIKLDNPNQVSGDWSIEKFGQAISLGELKTSYQWQKDSLPT